MYRIGTFNKISPRGLDQFSEDDRFALEKESAEVDAIVVRSHSLLDATLGSGVKAIGRAGAGVNNSPVDRCTQDGIVVFNTPGANANAVKELVLAGLLLTARDIVGGVEFVKGLKGKGNEISGIVEKNKSNFVGIELIGKRLGVMGLGAIGTMVANDAISLGMTVEGYDPFISVDWAWRLSKEVKRAESLEKMLKSVDFLTIHVPLVADTRGFLNASRLKHLKKSAVLLNFSRSEVVVEADVISALNGGVFRKYICDFPSEALLGTPNAVCLPHLGASTHEAEENCAVMIARQLKDFLLYGNIRNSVNFPTCVMEPTSDARLTIINRNVPNMVGQITTVIAEHKGNISEMMNKSRGDVAYNIVDFSGIKNTKALIADLQHVDGIVNVRLIAGA
jgi:D-3-phosphoglycerate dehydrogenase